MQATEKDALCSGGTGWSDSSPTMTDSRPESPQATNKTQAFDLFNLVVAYKRIEVYLEPLRDAWDVIRYLLRWQTPILSLLTFFIVNVLLLTLNEVAWFSVGALLVSIPALIGYLQEMSRKRIPEAELARRKYYCVQREDLQKVKLTRQEAVAEFKSFLIQLEGVLNVMCGTCERAYHVLYWQNPSASFQLYGLLLGSVCIIYLMPLCWVLTILNSTLFLRNANFYRVVAECKASLQQRSGSEPLLLEPSQVTQEAENISIVERTPTPPVPTSPEFSSCSDSSEFTSHKLDLSPGSVEEAEEAEPDDEFKDAIEEQLITMEDDDVSQCASEYELIQDNGFLSRNDAIKSKVSKLTERLRKRYPTNNLGNCYGCNAPFSILLKKRLCCNNCGNSFCSRCCSYKVPKSAMGATAPDAQKETVFVCAPCNQVLSK
ncbi:PREDICTED: protrudin isoform X1 [Nanorana parkeri]|uniref:protrudin isoform X1 n=1 Tax=Nanorana parkeri TaxID=125878 RepID=UPI000854B766|nr:PREDICTED: protrudin isoform X1 [Nanorana parkeri]